MGKEGYLRNGEGEGSMDEWIIPAFVNMREGEMGRWMPFEP